MTVADKFVGRQVFAKRGLGQTRGIVVEAKRIWSGNWILLVTPDSNGIGFWVNSRKCRLAEESSAPTLGV
jgi:hypothetical protein